MTIRPFRRRGSRKCASQHDRAGTVRAVTTATPACSPLERAQITRLIVEVGDRAAIWRCAAVEAEVAFERWKSAVGPDHGGAAADYLAAIAQEEQAANAYRLAVSACAGAAPRRGSQAWAWKAETSP